MKTEAAARGRHEVRARFCLLIYYFMFEDSVPTRQGPCGGENSVVSKTKDIARAVLFLRRPERQRAKGLGLWYDGHPPWDINGRDSDGQE